MNAKQLIRIALVLLGALALWGALAVSRRSGRDTPARLAMPKVERTAVTRIDIRKGVDSVMVRKADQKWTANGFPASAASVAEFLTALGDTAATTALVAQAAATHQRLGVDTAARMVAIYAGSDSAIARFLLGNRGPDFEGYYVRLADANDVYLARGSWPDLASRGLDEWRDREIVRIAPDSLRGIEITLGKKSYSLEKDSVLWRLTSGQAVDSGAAARLAEGLLDMRASGFPTQAQSDSATFLKPQRRLRLKGPGGALLLSLLMDSTATGFLVRPEEGGVVYRIDQIMMDRLTPALSVVLKK